jgi:hypothetical protein
MARHFSGSYEGADARRKQESEDSSLFGSSQSSSHANMPTEVIFRSVSNPHSNMPENINDTMKGVDAQIKGDGSGFRKNLNPKH